MVAFHPRKPQPPAPSGAFFEASAGSTSLSSFKSVGAIVGLKNLVEPEEEREWLEVAEDETSLDFLQKVYRSSRQPLSTRMRAAAIALPVREPQAHRDGRLGAMDGNDFAAMLERAIARSQAPAHRSNTSPPSETSAIGSPSGHPGPIRCPTLTVDREAGLTHLGRCGLPPARLVVENNPRSYEWESLPAKGAAQGEGPVRATAPLARP